MGVDIYENSSDCTFKMGVVCKLYLDKKNENPIATLYVLIKKYLHAYYVKKSKM